MSFLGAFARVGTLVCGLVLGAMACALPAAVPTPTPTALAINGPTMTATEEATETLPTDAPPTEAVAHFVLPSDPPRPKQFLSDVDTSNVAGEERALTGDNYERNRFERPFESGLMSYRPDLDIVRGEITLDDSFIYFLFTLKGEAPEGGFPGSYSAELDLDLDGRGDWLVMSRAPAPEWSVEGVRIFTDSNEDIGGEVPIDADPQLSGGNGYDTQMFDSGRGDDPDSAWVRLQAGEVPVVQLALKRDVVDDVSFLWGLWADDGLASPALFDYVDRIEAVDAGSPLRESEFYPVAQVAAVDNTCRMAQGFSPTGTEPGLCVIFGTVQNCTFHPMLMVPGNILFGGQQAGSATRHDIAPGTYSFYDQNVLDNDDNHPLVLTANLSPNGNIEIKTDGNDNTYPCP
jgi:hypothetical protein